MMPSARAGHGTAWPPPAGNSVDLSLSLSPPLTLLDFGSLPNLDSRLRRRLPPVRPLLPLLLSPCWPLRALGVARCPGVVVAVGSPCWCRRLASLAAVDPFRLSMVLDGLAKGSCGLGSSATWRSLCLYAPR